MQGDSNDKASLEKAMSGATAVFAVTSYWEKMDGELETQQGKNMADAAKVSVASPSPRPDLLPASTDDD